MKTRPALFVGLGIYKGYVARGLRQGDGLLVGFYDSIALI